MAEAARTNRGRTYPSGTRGSVNKSLEMRLPGKGNITGHREGDWPANAKSCADGMNAVVPGSGSCGSVDYIKG